MTRRVGRFAILLFAFAAMPGRVEAFPFVSSVGLLFPDSTLTFDEIVLPMGADITNQYAAFGVTFSPGLYYSPVPPPPQVFPGSSGQYVSTYTMDPVQPVRDDFSIHFEAVQIAAAFGFQTAPGTSTFYARLGGNVVESFMQATTFDNPNTAFIGFAGILFDEIFIQVGGATGRAFVDNIQQGPAPTAVPEPASVLLLGTGLAGLAVRRYRRQRS